MDIFGRNPADLTGALFKANNLGDLPDKAAARASLSVPSIAEVQYTSVPVGAILPYWGNTAPAGYLPCSGQTITSSVFPELVTFLGGTTSAVVPDLRGEFLRGWDNGRGVDGGRAAMSYQLDALQNLTGSMTSADSQGLAATGTTSGVYAGTSSAVLKGTTAAIPAITSMTFDASRVARTSTETRPRNAAVLYCIKAYSAISNFTSSINIAGLVGDYSALQAASVKYADFQGANQNTAAIGYQKLPGGMIIQWGASTTSGTVGTAVSVLYPTAFSTRVCGISVNRTAATIGSDFNTFSIDSNGSLTAFPVRCQLASATFYWIAFGF